MKSCRYCQNPFRCELVGCPGYVLIHRDLGPDFKHTDEDCVCIPFVLDSNDPRSNDEIIEEVKKFHVTH